MFFTGFKFRSPAGYLSEREQAALIEYVLTRVAAQPATNHELCQVLEGRKEASELSESTLNSLREFARQFIAVGKPLTQPKAAVLARVQLVSRAVK